LCRSVTNSIDRRCRKKYSFGKLQDSARVPQQKALWNGEKMRKKYKSTIIQIVAGLMVSVIVMYAQGVFAREDRADIIRGVCDGFTVTALIYVAFGMLFWISTTGFFDIFGFAFRKGMHHFLPVFVREDPGGYYEYKIDREEKRQVKPQRSTLAVGLLFLAVSIILTFVWYGTAAK